MNLIARRKMLFGMGAMPLIFGRTAMAGGPSQVTVESVQISGVDGLSGLLMKPSKGGKYPAVIVAHAERGFDAHAKDVATRLAAEGFVALAIDYLSPEGGTPSDTAHAGRMMRALGFTNTLERSRAAFVWLKQRPDCNGKIGALGFGWGGGVASDLAVIEPGLVAAVSYYGPQANYFLGLEYKDMKAAMMLHYAGRDRAINVGIAQYDGILRNEATIPAPEIFIYAGVDHGFADPTDAAHYDKQSAELAWTRSIAFLKKYLTKTGA